MLSPQKASQPQPALAHIFPTVLIVCPQHKCGSAQNDLGCHPSMCCLEVSWLCSAPPADFSLHFQDWKKAVPLVKCSGVFWCLRRSTVKGHMKHDSASENTKHLEIPLMVLPGHVQSSLWKSKQNYSKKTNLTHSHNPWDSGIITILSGCAITRRPQIPLLPSGQDMARKALVDTESKPIPGRWVLKYHVSVGV